MITITNTTNSALTYNGQLLPPALPCEIDEKEKALWFENPSLKTLYENGTLLVSATKITPRQLRLSLFIVKGLSDADVVAAVNQLPEPDRTLALVAWEYSIEYDRTEPMVDAVAYLLNLTAQDVIDVWNAGVLL